MNQVSKVLIVDDDLIACETLASLLNSEFYNILIAHSGKEAIETTTKEKPDLILLDVMMPEMDGFDVCQKIRNDPSIENIPIIMITALDDRESKLRGIETGADDYISKPFDRLELRLRIKTILKLNRFHCIEEEKERNEKLLSMSPHGIVIIDQKGSIETLNQTFFDMLGMTKECTLKGNLLESYIHPDHQVNYRNKLKELDQNPTQRLILETFIMSASGFFLPVQMMIGRFPGKSGDSYQLNIRDLSYEKKIVSDLNILMKAVQQSQIMFMILDLDLNLTYVNPQTCSKMGYTEKELLGTKFTKHYPFELNQAFHNNLKTIRKEKKEWKGELVCVTKPGESLNECVSISPLTDATGYVTHYVKISEETTNKSH